MQLVSDQDVTGQVLQQSGSFTKKLEGAQQSFRDNSAARGAVGRHLADLAEQVELIKESLKQIRLISTQVKMLSINAAIEAARAGAAGRGFAVVASEIGNLSQNTDSVVRTIDERIQNMDRLLSSTTSNMDNAKKIGGEFDAQLDSCVKDMQLLNQALTNALTDALSDTSAVLASQP